MNTNPLDTIAHKMNTNPLDTIVHRINNNYIGYNSS